MESPNYPLAFSLQTLGSDMRVTGIVAGVPREKVHRIESTGCCLLASGAWKATEKKAEVTESIASYHIPSVGQPLPQWLMESREFLLYILTFLAHQRQVKGTEP